MRMVPGRVADLDDADADRLRDVGLAAFRAVERVAASERVNDFETAQCGI